jgi:hypothetical protein
VFVLLNENPMFTACAAGAKASPAAQSAAASVDVFRIPQSPDPLSVQDFGSPEYR